MDVRKITVVSTRDQKRTVVETDATNLAELKAALRAANIDYANMTFYEALTRTELTQDESVLPHDVEYKGVITNELVFMLTNPNKKIKSGALSEARVALYNEVINNGFADAVAAKYGKNFTNCSNAELAAFLDEHAQPEEEYIDAAARRAIVKLIDLLYEEGYITSCDAESIKSSLTVDTPTEPEAGPYSDAEIDELMATLPENIR